LATAPNSEQELRRGDRDWLINAPIAVSPPIEAAVHS
jgi:hypothetical protein